MSLVSDATLDTLSTASLALTFNLIAFVLYLMIPVGIRHRYFGAVKRRYPCKRLLEENELYSRSRTVIEQAASLEGISEVNNASVSHTSVNHASVNGRPSHLEMNQPQARGSDAGYLDDPSEGGEEVVFGENLIPPRERYNNSSSSNNNNNNSNNNNKGNTNTYGASLATTSSASVSELQDGAMSLMLVMLRGEGVLLTAHGTKGKGKKVRVTVEGDRICWRTSLGLNTQAVAGKKTLRRKKNAGNEGKRHDVLLHDCMAVDVGKRTAPLRRVEATGVDPKLCFSLLTKGGSLDLEAQTAHECETLVRTFSLMLDELHKVNELKKNKKKNKPNFPFVDSREGREGSLVNFV